jgi:IclR family transcriptional regulator, KDG regulon repressor
MDPRRVPSDGNLTLTVLKALDVLECLAFSAQSLSAPEVAERCGLTRPTAYRLLSTLASRGYVANGQDGRYLLGTKMLSLSRRLIDNVELPRLARPNLETLCHDVGEAVHLAVLDNTEVLYIDKIESSAAARMYSVIGTRNPLHCTSLGKAILAFLPEDDRRSILDRVSLTQRTGNTITDRAVLEDHLDAVRDQGYALDDVENEVGIRCVGAPVLSNAGLPIAALSISGPTIRMTRDRATEVAAVVRNTAYEISRKLGYVSPGQTGTQGPTQVESTSATPTVE